MPEKEIRAHERKFGTLVKITAGLMVVVFVVLLFEVSARVVYAYREHIRFNSFFSGFLQHSPSLDPYEMPAPGKMGHWVLRPGYQASLAELLADKESQGREIGLRGLLAGSKDGGSDEKIHIRINKSGFKGEEIDFGHTRPRILALGDSITFGLGKVDYPKIMGNKLLNQGIQVEVINAGVEGYSSQSVLLEMDHYKPLKPEIALLFIGWNDLFSRTPWPEALENQFKIVWLLKKATRALKMVLGNAQGQARTLYYRDIKPVRNHADVTGLDSFTPPVLDQINQIISEFESIGTGVVLVTLPGLFTMRADPSPKALKIGHLPYFTDNPFVLAKLTERYNVALKTLAERREVDIIDLDKWSWEALRPRESFFYDSVHLTAPGLERIGAYLAEQIAGRLKKLRKKASTFQ